MTLETTFFADRGIDTELANPQQLLAAQLVSDVATTTLDLIRHAHTTLVDDPIWGLMLAAYWRMEHYAESSIIASVVSNVAGEIVARTVVEAAVNFQYILSGNPAERLYTYFDAYIRKELAENQKWQKEIDRLPPNEERLAHQRGLDRKATVLAFQRQLIDSNFASVGINPHSKRNWGTTFDRFVSLGQAIEYRTVYAGLCSQVHNDAEDLLNGFTIAVADDPTQAQGSKDETQAFGWFAVTLGIRQYVRAATDYWSTFDLMKGQSEIMDSARSLAETLAAHAAHAVSGGSLE